MVKILWLPEMQNDSKQLETGIILCALFMCDLCHFRRLKWRDPDSSQASDELTLLCIRRANLDAFWAREPGRWQQI